MTSYVCPHRIKNQCEIASAIVAMPVPCLPEVCDRCANCDRPFRINLITISLANETRTLTSEEIDRLTDIVDDKIRGFGSRLENIFNFLNIQQTRDCPCLGHKDILNLWTPSYIRNNMDRVVRWLRNESRKRRLPFYAPLVRRVLRRLISEG